MSATVTKIDRRAFKLYSVKGGVACVLERRPVSGPCRPLAAWCRRHWALLVTIGVVVAMGVAKAVKP